MLHAAGLILNGQQMRYCEQRGPPLLVLAGLGVGLHPPLVKQAANSVVRDVNTIIYSSSFEHHIEENREKRERTLAFYHSISEKALRGQWQIWLDPADLHVV